MPGEAARLVAAYGAGVSIILLARRHERSRYSIAAARLVAEGRDGKLSEVFQIDDADAAAVEPEKPAPQELQI